MSNMVGENGELDFPEFHAKSHKSKKTNEWIHTKCGELHDEIVNLQVAATEAGTPLTQEELSRQVLGQKKNYLRGFDIGPRPLCHMIVWHELVTNIWRQCEWRWRFFVKNAKKITKS
ncbi:hypothetical protein CsSME_00040249 [Camellia sinensis var. sinensis]